ncbi:MAG: hypothetical protein JWL76_1012 [Thermoleophilia bacterium]|nr:hypothetical protein [Thermoleophilia bacterium]
MARGSRGNGGGVVRFVGNWMTFPPCSLVDSVPRPSFMRSPLVQPVGMLDACQTGEDIGRLCNLLTGNREGRSSGFGRAGSGARGRVSAALLALVLAVAVAIAVGRSRAFDALGSGGAGGVDLVAMPLELFGAIEVCE